MPNTDSHNINADLLEVMATVMAAAHETPLERRARLYRGLAGICGDQHEQAELLRLADECARAHERCRAVEFSFFQKHSAIIGGAR